MVYEASKCNVAAAIKNISHNPIVIKINLTWKNKSKWKLRISTKKRIIKI